jgi:hypothetical protein
MNYIKIIGAVLLAIYRCVVLILLLILVENSTELDFSHQWRTGLLLITCVGSIWNDIGVWRDVQD